MRGDVAKPDAARQRATYLTPHLERLKPSLLKVFENDRVTELPRPELALRIGNVVTSELSKTSTNLNLLDRRTLVAELITWLLHCSPLAPAADSPEQIAQLEAAESAKRRKDSSSSNVAMVETAKQRVQPLVMERLDLAAASQLPRAELAHQMADIVKEVLHEEKIRLNGPEQQSVIDLLLDDMLGLGPLEPLLADDHGLARSEFTGYPYVCVVTVQQGHWFCPDAVLFIQGVE